MPALGHAGDGGVIPAYSQRSNALPMLFLRQRDLFDSENNVCADADPAGCLAAAFFRNRKSFSPRSGDGEAQLPKQPPFSSSDSGRFPSSGRPAALSAVLRPVDLIPLL
jgi:hypothetical protein